MISPTKRELGKSYEPAGFESDLYQFWEKSGFFEAQDTNDKSDPGQKAFCIVIPPPNVTGALHMGHALTNTIQDILIRWRRMHGDNTLWMPGTDHAGIATQAQVEKQIAKEGKGPTGRPLNRHDMGRDAFVKRVWEWKEEHGSKIKNQLRRLGSSLDWKRERFTMDEGLSKAVREVFVRLYEEKLIYRGERIINWCTKCQTALSDLEVIPTDRKGHLWHIAYPVEGSNTKLVIATTRPETLLGDTAVAVHPEDERYKSLQGKKVKLPLLGRTIPIIADAYVDKEFGSGALKVTPAHDFNDYELGKRHNLPFITVMGKDGKITADGGPYAGLKFAEAREKVVEDLKAAGLLVKVEDHANKVGLCQRSDTVAEPIVSKQWFVKIEPLAKPAIQAVESGKITFTPKNWEKTYFEWMYNIRDWCISRQLWWGHQIPAWYCGKCEHITVSRTTPSKCEGCGGGTLKQDEDVLDTWFSSGLWPFSTLGWPEKTPALQTFYPTSILETGFDIIFFWVARMIMMGIHFMGDVPFRKVYLHAMVRDEKGEKMSKTKGNVIDPLDIIDQHGADPLRLTLAAMAGQGRDIKLSTDRVEGYRGFCNKLWNATKFFHLQMDQCKDAVAQIPKEVQTGGAEAWLVKNQKQLTPYNRWILSALQGVTARVEAGFANFEINESAQGAYDFTWYQFCDWYVEISKVLLKPGSRPAAVQVETLITYHYTIETLLKLMHPMIPFVTEELWQSLPWAQPIQNARFSQPVKTLMLQKFPAVQKGLIDQSVEKQLQAIQAQVEAIRNFRGENNISPKTRFPVEVIASTKEAEALNREHESVICSLAQIEKMDFVSGKASGKSDLMAVIPIPAFQLEFRVGLKGLVDVEEESKRLKKEVEKTKADLEFIRNKLSKESFISKAPAELVQKEKAREQEIQGKLGDLEKALERLAKLK
ncbi:valine--tRNA ligase [bacterium]|jgi:valyl-tRNA synthetase|nr:valine--tRNA ligase [bacterium]